MATGSGNNIRGEWGPLQSIANIVDEVFAGYETRQIFRPDKEVVVPKGPAGPNSLSNPATSQQRPQCSQAQIPGEPHLSPTADTGDHGQPKLEVSATEINRATKTNREPHPGLVTSPHESDDTTHLRLDFTDHVLEGLSLLLVREQRRPLRRLWTGFTFLLWIAATAVLAFVGHLLHLY